MATYRLSHAAQADIAAVLAWSREEFGEASHARYESLIVTALRDAASLEQSIGRRARPELGDGVFSWHLAQSRLRSPGGTVRRPRHFLVCRWDGDVLVVGRLLHDSMDVPGHLGAVD